MEPYQSLLDQAKRHALAYMDQVRDMPPYPSEKSLDGLETLEETYREAERSLRPFWNCCAPPGKTERRRKPADDTSVLLTAAYCRLRRPPNGSQARGTKTERRPLCRR